MAKLALSAPWNTLYRKIKCMFDKDPDVEILYDEEEATINVFVADKVKAAAIEKLLPALVSFGNISVNIKIVPGANPGTPGPSTFDEAFTGNGAFCYVKTIERFGAPISYIVLSNEVVQFFNDDIGDLYGLCSTLYEDIARDIFNAFNGVFYCTEPTGSLGTPLGEWP